LTTQMSPSNSTIRFGETQLSPKRFQVEMNIHNSLSSRTAEADPGPCAAKTRGGPRAPLRSGGDDTWLETSTYTTPCHPGRRKPIRDCLLRIELSDLGSTHQD
jgi:hypothetical protein